MLILEQEKDNINRHIEINKEARKLWYVFILGQAKRNLAIERMENLGCEVYEPLRHYDRKHHRTKKLLRKTTPLMGDYVFATVPSLDFGAVTGVDGVHGYLSQSNSLDPSSPVPAPIKLGAVEDIMIQEYNDEFNESVLLKNNASREKQIARLEEMLPVGSYIRINHGLLTGQYAQVDEISGPESLKVALQLMGRMTKISLTVEQVERL